MSDVGTGDTSGAKERRTREPSLTVTARRNVDDDDDDDGVGVGGVSRVAVEGQGGAEADVLRMVASLSPAVPSATSAPATPAAPATLAALAAPAALAALAIWAVVPALIVWADWSIAMVECGTTRSTACVDVSMMASPPEPDPFAYEAPRMLADAAVATVGDDAAAGTATAAPPPASVACAATTPTPPTRDCGRVRRAATATAAAFGVSGIRTATTVAGDAAGTTLVISKTRRVTVSGSGEGVRGSALAVGGRVCVRGPGG